MSDRDSTPEEHIRDLRLEVARLTAALDEIRLLCEDATKSPRSVAHHFLAQIRTLAAHRARIGDDHG